MDNQKKVYILLIALAAMVLAGLLVLAGCISINGNTDSTEPTGNQAEPTGQVSQDPTGEGATLPEDATSTQGTKPGNANAETTDATDPTDETEETEATKATEKVEGGNKPTTKPDPDNTEPTLPSIPNEYPYTLSYKEYLAMSEKEQIAFYKLFPNHDEFKKWRTVAKKEYDDNRIEIEIDENGNINLDEALKGQN